MPSRRTLLIGGAGLVGRHIGAALAQDDLTVTYHRSTVAGGVALDITDSRAVRRLIESRRPEVIILAAADPFVERCEREPAATRAINVAAARTIAEMAAQIGALLVVFSSEYVFDGKAGSYAEDDQVAPINEYGRQKVELEELARGRPGHLICRVSGVYGWSKARTNFVAQLVDALRASRRFSVPADQVITPTPAPDLAQAVVELLNVGARGLFHVAGPEILPRPDFAERAALAFGLDPRLLDAIPTERLGLAARRPLRAGLRTDKLLRTLGHGLRPSREALLAMREAEPAIGGSV